MNAQDRIVDRRITTSAPYPIAAAWSRVLVAPNASERHQRAIDAVSVVLRTLAAIAAADALAADPAVVTGQQRLWAQLARPSLGHWVELLRELTRHNGTPFVPELKQALFDGRGRPSAVLDGIGELVTLRNRMAHGSAMERPEEGAIEQRLRDLLDGQRWLEGYRVVRVLRATPRRSGDTEGELQLFVGQIPLTEPLHASWSARLVPDVLYLCAPDGRRLLDVTPFLEVGEDPSVRAPRCLLIHALGTTSSLESVETGQRIEVPPELARTTPRIVAVPELAEVLAVRVAPVAEFSGSPDGAGEFRRSADGAAESSRSPDVALAARSPSRWRWVRRLGVVAALGAVALLAATLLLVDWMYPDYTVDPPPLTLAGVPQLYEDPADQRRLEQAHAAMVEGDELTAAMRLQPLLDRRGIPPEVAAFASLSDNVLPEAKYRAFLGVDGDRQHEDSAVAHCARELKSASTMDQGLGMAAFLPRLVRIGNGMRSRLERHPDDLIAGFCLCMSPLHDCSGWLQGLGDPSDAPMLLSTRGELTLERVEAALARRPGSPSLERWRIQALMEARRWNEAAADIDPLVAEYPARLDLRLIAAELALRRGDDASFRRHYELLRSGEWGPVVGYNTDRVLVAAAVQSGRPQLALEVWGNPEIRAGWYSALHSLAPVAAYPDLCEEPLARAILEKAQIALAAPVDDAAALQARRNQAFYASTIERQVALRNDPSSVPDALIDDQSRLFPHYPASVQVAAWRGDGAAVLGALDLPAPDATWTRQDCINASVGAALLEVAGEPAASLDHRQRLVAQDDCQTLEHTHELAMAHGNLALAAKEDGDLAVAESHAAAFADLWPRPEPEVPIVRRMVEAGLFTLPPEVASPADLDEDGAP